MEEQYITREQLITYILSFNKQRGNYTNDELFLIGREHKKLPARERDWKWLSEIVGYEKGGESYRCMVKNRQARTGELPANKNYLGIRSLEQLDSDEINEKLNDFYKQQTRTRDALNSYRRNIREEARIDSFRDSLIEAIEELPPLEKVEKVVCKVEKGKEAVLLLSDMHIGVVCDNFYNKYNLEIAKKRIDLLVQKVIEYCQRNNVETLNVVNLGDLIHGIIHTNARIEQEFDVSKQIINASEIIASALNTLQKAAKKVYYRSVIDNHSRVIANKSEHIETESFCKIIDWYLEERLKSSKILFVKDNIDDTIGKFKIGDKTIMFSHGHLDNVNEAFQHFVGASQEYVDIILLGHYHCEKAKSYQNTKVIVNGSIVGTEQYALSKRLFSKPSQTLLIFDGEDLINHSINLEI